MTRQVAPPLVHLDSVLWRRWALVTTAGELAGFCAPACAGAVTTAGHVTGLRQAAILVAAGAVEGVMLGWAQATVLRRVVTGLDTRSWVRATALGAVVAYAMGMVPSLFFPLPLPAMVAIAAVAGTVLLGSMGTAQWLVLRRHRAGSPSVRGPKSRQLRRLFPAA